jgi:hypothetical protein
MWSDDQIEWILPREQHPRYDMCMARRNNEPDTHELMPFVLELLRNEPAPIHRSMVIERAMRFGEAKGRGKRPESAGFALTRLKKAGLAWNRNGFWAATDQGKITQLSEADAKEHQTAQSRSESERRRQRQS